MKTLLVLRHAKSSWNDASLADHDRPLKKRGRQSAPRMGRWVASRDLVPDLIISSTAVRARETAAAVAEACAYAGEIALAPELYGAQPADVIAQLHAVAAERVMVVGHNPTLEELVGDLTGVDARMPTAALAQIEIDVEQWSDVRLDGGATLVNLWLVKELPDED